MAVLVQCPACGGIGGHPTRDEFGVRDLDPLCDLCDGNGECYQHEADEYLGVQTDAERAACWREWEAAR